SLIRSTYDYVTSSCDHAVSVLFFFFNGTATTELYTLSLHDALPISSCSPGCGQSRDAAARSWKRRWSSAISSSTRNAVACAAAIDRKSTRLNSSHVAISYAVFCLKKKKKKKNYHRLDKDVSTGTVRT